VVEPFAVLVRARAEDAGLKVTDDLVEAQAAYLTLLARWNRTINLTAFDLDAPTDAAIDRLIIEPLRAARLVSPTDRLLIDIGSGGGSPAIPLRLARPQLETVLVEARERKAAFLREAARALALDNVVVETDTFERFSVRPEWAQRADLVTMRAVRPEPGIWRGAHAVSRSTARFFWFSGMGETTNYLGLFAIEADVDHVIVLSPVRDL
jgi:16S rRNA (guanine527-N7)-methyltransferase